jgi:hypothetical protein
MEAMEKNVKLSDETIVTLIKIGIKEFTPQNEGEVIEALDGKVSSLVTAHETFGKDIDESFLKSLDKATDEIMDCDQANGSFDYEYINSRFKALK